MLRCEGKVVRVEERPWSKEGRSGAIVTIRVLVGGVDIETLQLGRELETLHPRRGDAVDLAVKVESYRGTPQLVAFDTWAQATGELPGSVDPVKKLAAATG